jgi:hypothetical protein
MCLDNVWRFIGLNTRNDEIFDIDLQIFNHNGSIEGRVQ